MSPQTEQPVEVSIHLSPDLHRALTACAQDESATLDEIIEAGCIVFLSAWTRPSGATGAISIDQRRLKRDTSRIVERLIAEFPGAFTADNQ